MPQRRLRQKRAITAEGRVTVTANCVTGRPESRESISAMSRTVASKAPVTATSVAVEEGQPSMARNSREKHPYITEDVMKIMSSIRFHAKDGSVHTIVCTDTEAIGVGRKDFSGPFEVTVLSVTSGGTPLENLFQAVRAVKEITRSDVLGLAVSLHIAVRPEESIRHFGSEAAFRLHHEQMVPT